MKLTQAFKMALKSIVTNKMRSFLTMLGIIIGISSVIVMIAIGNGSEQQISSSIEGMGTNLLTVSFTGTETATITSADITKLKKTGYIKAVAPEVSGTATAKVGDESSSTSIEGTNASYSEVRDLTVAYGRFITQDDLDNRYKVIDVGVELLQNLYPDLTADDYQTVIGDSIALNGTKFEIVGILESKGTSTTGSSDNRVIMPLTTAERFLKSTSVKTYYMEASSSDSIDSATTVLDRLLNQKFSDDTSQYRVLDQSELLSTRTQTTNEMTMLLAGIAAISLIVGGIGIMNIMLVSVAERTREIGIRKAIGAKRRDIMSQFLIEAVVISGLGGICGVLFGVVVSLLVPHLLSYTTALSLNVILLSFAFSVGVGIVFGLYPAAKASKLRPIEALRYE